MRLIRFPSHWTKTQLWLLLKGGGAKWSKSFGKSPNPSDPHAQIRDIWWVPPPPVDFWPPNLNPMSLPDALSNPSCRAFIIDLAFSSDTASVIKMGNVSRLFQTLTSSSHKDETVLIMYVLAHRFQYVLKSFGLRGKNWRSNVFRCSGGVVLSELVWNVRGLPWIRLPTSMHYLWQGILVEITSFLEKHSIIFTTELARP